MRGRIERRILFRRRARLVPRNLRAVRFRCGSQINDEFRYRNIAFRRTETLIGVPRRNRHRQSLGIGKADILHRKPRQTAQKIERIFSALDHARRPVERRIGIRTAQGFMQRADEIVVSLAVLVVNRRAVLDDFFQIRPVHHSVCRSEIVDAFNKIDKITPVAVGKVANHRHCVIVNRKFASDDFFRPFNNLLKCGGIQRFHDEDLAAGEKRAVEFERRVFRRCADECHRAVFDVGQKTVLLCAVEAVNLIDEQQRPFSVKPPFCGFVKRLAEVGDSGKDGGERNEMHVGSVRHQPCNRGLSASGRTPENETGNAFRLQHLADRAVGSEQMILPDDVVDRFRTETVGKRPVSGLFKKQSFFHNQ